MYVGSHTFVGKCISSLSEMCFLGNMGAKKYILRRGLERYI